jgi:hypothetical protein
MGWGQMTDFLWGEIKKAIQDAVRKPLVICGAGVSIHATDGTAPSWAALIQSGIKRVTDLDAGAADWAAQSRDELTANPSTANWIAIADDVTEKLGGLNNAEFSSWLGTAVGQIVSVRNDLLEAVLALGCPVATTNYDDIFVKASGREPITWDDYAGTHQFLHGERDGILHLHGHWRRPKSVVLGSKSYDAHTSNLRREMLQRMAAIERPSLFIGCSEDGLSDPDFSRLDSFLAEWQDVAPRRYWFIRHDKTAGAPPPPDHSKRLFPVVFGSSHDDLAPMLRTLAPQTAMPSRPPKPDRCFGREDDEKEVVAALTSGASTPVILLGPGGVGKTTLASTVLYHKAIEARFGGRIWFAELTNSRSAAQMEAEITRALRLNSGQTSFDYTLARLKARSPALLVLDNLETPWNDVDRRNIRELLKQLAAVEGVTLLATFRGYAPPDAPVWISKRIERLNDKAARELFLSFAGPRVANDPLLDHFLSELQGYTLQIKLVAARAAYRPNLKTLWEQWQRTGAAHFVDSDPSDERHTSQGHVVAFSWQSSRLRPAAKRLFQLLGQLPSGIAKEDRQALLGGDAEQAAEDLYALALAEWSQDGERLDLLPPVRDVARQQYLPDDQDRLLWLRHYLAFAKEQGMLLRRASAKTAAARITPEIANIEAAIAAAIAAGCPEEVGPIAYGYSLALGFTGLGDPAGLRAAAEACGRPNYAIAAAQCLCALGKIEHLRADPQNSRIDLERAVALSRKTGDESVLANCLKGLAELDRMQSNKRDVARAGYAEGRMLYERLSDDLGKAHCVWGLADLDRIDSNKPEEARAGYTEAKVLYERLGDDLGKANSLQGLADLDCLESDKCDAARAGYTEAQALYARLGDDLGKANTLQSLAYLDSMKPDRRDAACAGYAEARAIFERLGNDLGKAHCVRGLAHLDSLEHDRRDVARTGYTEAQALYEREADDLGKANCLKGLAELAEAEHNNEQACALYREAEALYRATMQMNPAAWVAYKRRQLGCR